MPAPSGPVRAATVVEDHRQLRLAVDELAQHAIHTPPLGEGGRWCGELASRLEDLSTRLLQHFRSEEEMGGFYAELVRALPAAEDEVRGLKEQHARLIGRCHSLKTLAGTTPVDGEAFYRLAAQVAALVAELASHEGHESELMLRAVQGAPPASAR